ncbi:MDR family MFS transporter [Halalkalibacterium halodurans]|uniref:MDR family MFS transporter n=1 Tax=Halalkalibacterium halodurans TaxID=86665 RepID=UPI002E23BE5D|nr:MDR family MFS transporter [Halalkalibacterium halodurans]MED4161727.1 MDR family MFS transporter [Halalkalibacterium halodurans]
MKNIPKKWMVVCAVLFGSFTMILNNSMLNPAIPQLMNVFEADAVATGWVITIFMVAMGMTMPLTGYLGDKIGKKEAYILGLGIFVLGSLLGALSWNLPSLIVFRGLQGIGGGIMMPLSMTLIFDAFPRNERGLATGVWGVASMMAPTIGPTLGGFIVETSNWKYLFLVNIPFGLLGIIAAVIYLPKIARSGQIKLDRWGFLFVTAGVGSILLAFGRMSDLTHLTEWINGVLLLLGALCLYVFVQVEKRAEQPLLDLSLFRIPAYSLSIWVAGISSIGLFAGIFLVPLLLQQVYDYGPIMTGLVFLPSALFTGLTMSIGGRMLDKRGPSGIMTAGMMIAAVGTFALGYLHLETALWYIFAWMAIRGVGMGLTTMPATTTGMNAIPEGLISRGSAMNNVLRQMSSAFGIVFISVFFEVRRGQLALVSTSFEEATLQAINEGFFIVGFLTALSIPAAYWLEKKAKQGEQERVNSTAS